jgi:hypothetical protein
MLSWLFFFCHTYIIIAPECMLSWLFFFCHCPTNATQSPKAVQKYWKLKCVSIRGAISWGLFCPLPMKETELWSNPIWDSGPRLEIILEFWPKDWSTFGLGLEPFSSTVEGFCIW